MSRYKQTFVIDSHARSTGTHTDFTHTVLMPQLGNIEAKDLSVAVVAASIPKTWYIVSAPRNTFVLTENGVAITITVPPSNYKWYDFMSVVQALMNAATRNGSVYTITNNDASCKFTFAVVGGPSSLTMPNANGSGLHDQFGLEPNGTVAIPFTSTNVYNFTTQSAVLIRSNIITGADDILQAVFAAESPAFSTIVYEGQDLETRARQLGSKETSTYYFRITDSDGNTLDTNGRPLTIVILIWCPIEIAIRDYLSLRASMILSDQKADPPAPAPAAAAAAEAAPPVAADEAPPPEPEGEFLSGAKAGAVAATGL